LVVGIAMYTDGTQPGSIDVTGDASPPTSFLPPSHSNIYVYVFTLTDGSLRAVGVQCRDSKPCVGLGAYPK
jgi:hypothetical protein